MHHDDFIDNALTRDEETIRDMFSREAPHYDLLNHVLSFNLDKGWRKSLVRESGFSKYGDNVRVLDLCTGTGDVLFEFLARRDFKGTCVGIDFAEPMIGLAQKKAEKTGVSDRVEFLTGNALALDFPDESFDIVTNTFGLRNLKDLESGVREMYRILKPGGKFVSVEFFRPVDKISLAISGWYVSYVIPFIGRVVSGRRGAYDYLPASRRDFVSADEFDRMLESGNFNSVMHREFLFRIASLHSAVK